MSRPSVRISIRMFLAFMSSALAQAEPPMAFDGMRTLVTSSQYIVLTGKATCDETSIIATS